VDESFASGIVNLWELARHYGETDTTVALLWFLEEALPEVETSRFGSRVAEDEALRELTGELSWKGKSRRR